MACRAVKHLALLLTAVLAIRAWAGAGENLLRHGCVLSGSDFAAVSKGWKLGDAAYFPLAADGDRESAWRAFAPAGPHYLGARWRTPVRIDRLAWHGKNFTSVQLCRWADGKFQPVVRVQGAEGEIRFPEILAERVHLELTGDHQTRPEMAEWELTGPEQPLLPAELPDKYLPGGTIRITPGTPLTVPGKPGERISFTFEAAWQEEHPEYPECYLLAELKEPHADGWLRLHHGDFEIANAPLIPLTGLTRQGKQFQGEITLPAWMPAGETPLRITILTADGKHLVRSSAAELLRIQYARQDTLPAAAPAAGIGGGSAWRGFLLDGQLEPPFMNHWCCAMDFERFYASGENSVNLQNIQLYPNALSVRQDWPKAFARLEQAVTAMLRVRPGVRILIGVDLRPSGTWKSAHPDAMMRNADGSLLLEHKRPVVSYGSPELLADSLDFFKALMDYVESRPWRTAIVGYMPWSNTKNDSYIGGIDDNRNLADRSKLHLGDFHPGALAAFRKFLRRKYQDDAEALRRAWHNPDVNFETAAPDPAMLGREDIPHGVFRDPAASRSAIDYWEFFPTLLGDYLRALGSYIKTRSGGKALVFVHYGSVINTMTSPQPTGNRIHSGNYDLPAMLRDPNIDMYVQAMPYEKRMAGQPVVVYQPTSSMALHNRMYMMDYDIRTINAGTLLFGRHRSIAETESIITRDLAWLYTRQAGAWFADMSQENFRKFTEERSSWIAGPEAARPAARMAELFRRERGSVPSPQSAAQVAFFFSTETPAYEDCLNGAVNYWMLIDKMFYAEVPKMGAPYDVYVAEDLTEKALPDYKLYCFVNLFHVTEAQRAAIERLKQNGHTLLFFYAPGYVGETGFQLEAASALTGVALQTDMTPAVASLQIQGSHPALAGSSTRTLSGKGWNGCNPVHPDAITPRFFVCDPQAEVLGTDERNRPALVLRKYPGYQVIYSALPFLSGDLLQSIARYAGVHLYCTDGTVMAADRHLLMFHNGCEAPRTVTVTPRPGTRVRDAWSGEVLSAGKPFALELNHPETRILLTEPIEKQGAVPHMGR